MHVLPGSETQATENAVGVTSVTIGPADTHGTTTILKHMVVIISHTPENLLILITYLLTFILSFPKNSKAILYEV
jgi:hypothetical protein